jgi:hypothetical protein
MSTLKEKIRSIIGADKMAELKQMFTTEKVFKDVKLADGSILRYEGDMPVEGLAVSMVTEAGEVPVPDGDYQLEDGSVISVAESKIKAVMPKAEEQPAEEPMKEEVMADYPWEQCISDMEAKYDSATAEKICGAIKAGTVGMRAHVEMAAKLVDLEKAIEVSKAEGISLHEAVNAVKAEMAKQHEVSKAMFGIVEALYAEPTEEPTEPKKDAFKKADRNARIARLAEAINNK